MLTKLCNHSCDFQIPLPVRSSCCMRLTLRRRRNVAPLWYRTHIAKLLRDVSGTGWLLYIDINASLRKLIVKIKYLQIFLISKLYRTDHSGWSGRFRYTFFFTIEYFIIKYTKIFSEKGRRLLFSFIRVSIWYCWHEIEYDSAERHVS